MIGAAVVLALLAQGVHPHASPPIARPRDPWVFRSVLDERARMITVALSEDIWVAYDAATCSLYGAWEGGVEFQGAVYDTVHGPQPTTSALLLLAPESGPGEVPPPWRVVRSADGEPLDVTPRYRGYRLLRDPERGEEVEFHWQLELAGDVVIDVREQPIGWERGTLVTEHPVHPHLYFQRGFEVSGLPEGVEIQIPSGVWTREAKSRWDERAAWSGTACAISGEAWGICRWEGVESPLEPHSVVLEVQRKRLASRAELVRAWLAEESDPAEPSWQPSLASLVDDGTGQLFFGLFPIDVAQDAQPEDGE